jgi:hypothetical protein
MEETGPFPQSATHEAPYPLELKLLLERAQDQTERERVIADFYKVAQGDPNSFLVQWSIYLQSVLARCRSYLDQIDQKQTAWLQAAPKIEADAAAIAETVASKVAFPEVEEIRALLADTEKALQSARNDAASLEARIQQFRSRSVRAAVVSAIIGLVAGLSFAGAFVWQDHVSLAHQVQEKASMAIRDTLGRLNVRDPSVTTVLSWGIHADLSCDERANPVIVFSGKPGVSDFGEAYRDGDRLRVTLRGY